ncbi:hypothetical protein B0T26DRAFT_730022 [Lasiosphaeria miniovina]|uniref:Uncharacterized protein n=1 Tax=Lasiosphaeria miniovina TaxID=1954250 RepID=A0AA40DKH9_9PEZI|nr:uncharacterized protein B0T26DRAFT_730022 [Lasiosphaeria miniovina]KAK0703158.1 hypothetical protein B0T26DRAFT_730022 [Lasiosphaeria miniovina]
MVNSTTPASQSAQWINQLLKDFGAHQPLPIVLFTDSINAKINVLNPLNAARTRCIDIRYECIINKVKKGMINVVHVPGAVNGTSRTHTQHQSGMKRTECLPLPKAGPRGRRQGRHNQPLRPSTAPCGHGCPRCQH